MYLYFSSTFCLICTSKQRRDSSQGRVKATPVGSSCHVLVFQQHVPLDPHAWNWGKGGVPKS